ncbi:dienelactone hydrolase family protein [Salinisphaera japonica]|uniref:Dienelactone hydrolase n=1 Tax=Salinisphaera japonica YTM-1 TaxID=1209778 RepID=A0A423PT19_9GAMM|nr:dienelactone hydrolase family protein [Salinisphaera japonica]ROO28756.1 dienelactone hydrolase [Salinisphaera japonica YTM-1]
MSRQISIQTADGAMDAHIFVPENADGPLPAVVLFTDIGGLRPCYFDKAQTVADNGYAVLMPNIYYRDAAGAVVPEGKSFRDDDVRPTLFEYAARLKPEAQSRDFAGLVDTLDAEAEFAAGPIGVVGYCLTGAFALRMAAQFPARVAAAAGFHAAKLAAKGDDNSPVHIVDQIRARVYFGHADKDEHLPPAQIARMEEALAAAGVHFTTELYAGAAHGYTAFDTPAYDEAADARHYKRLASLFEETLGLDNA